MTKSPQTLYDYYRRQDIFPTYGAFQSHNDLKAYALQRRDLFFEKLHLPPRVFQGAKLIEFGPDAGENSLVFALWKASCTLVEPNPNVLPTINNYFKRFDLFHRLADLVSMGLEEYAEAFDGKERFDIVDAEGFIYTVRPTAIWIDLFQRLLNTDGLVILFYYEMYGGYIELMLKALYQRFRDLTDLPPRDAAYGLFAAKWNSISHKRKFNSWLMDVLENPFVRLKYFFDLNLLLQEMQRAGLSLYSAWPPYQDGLDLYWYKKVLTPQQQLNSQRNFILRSRLSHMFARTLFLKGIEEKLQTTLHRLISETDRLIDAFDPERVQNCVEDLDEIIQVINSREILATEKTIRHTQQTIKSLQKLLQLMASGEPDEMINFCNSDPHFINCWGMPSHFAVFRKM